MLSRSALRRVLHMNRAAVMARGHVWDVADVLDALGDAGIVAEDDETDEPELTTWRSPIRKRSGTHD